MIDDPPELAATDHSDDDSSDSDYDEEENVRPDVPSGRTVRRPPATSLLARAGRQAAGLRAGEGEDSVSDDSDGSCKWGC